MTESKNADWHKFRALVVDDDDDMRMLIEAVVLGIWPHAEVVGFDPADASGTQIYDWSRYELLILDYQLGRQTGLDWLRQYRGMPNFPTTIFITGAGNEEVAVKALKLGAVDYVRKGEGFQGRLVAAINEALEEMGDQNRDLSDWERFLVHAEQTLQRGTKGALFYVMLDQFTAIKANQGLQIARHILTVLRQLVADELKSSGANVRTELHGENAVVALTTGLDDLSGIELQARRLLEQVRKVRFQVGRKPLAGTASVGVCVAHGDDSEPAKLVARAEAACHTAMLRGGDQSFLGTLRGEIGEAVSADQNVGKVWRDDTEISDILKQRRLRTLFHNVRRVGRAHGNPMCRAEPALSRVDGVTMDEAELGRFLSPQGRRTFLDRVTVNQTLRKLQAGALGVHAQVFLRLSGESTGMQRFWTWLGGRLAEVPVGAQLVFELGVRDAHQDEQSLAAIRALKANHGCAFALHGLLPDLDVGAWIGELPISYLVVDLGEQLALNHCDRIIHVVAEARSREVEVMLAGIDSNSKFACAFRAEASLLEGVMAADWDEVELSDTQTPAAWVR